jgi:hypothetical protein
MRNNIAVENHDMLKLVQFIFPFIRPSLCFFVLFLSSVCYLSLSFPMDLFMTSLLLSCQTVASCAGSFLAWITRSSC